MNEIKHVRVWSFAKISAATSFMVAVIFMIFGATFILASSIMGTPVPGTPIMDAGSFTLGAVFAIIVLTVCAIIGFIWGAILAFIYNVSADWFGGIEINIE
ncbi:MAG: hypothetical protein U9N40_07410 [Euryarchaeota archaeon]|nr:hypothetical protein [Euryarchaeota archaeon]